jgi:hypothetical protein
LSGAALQPAQHVGDAGLGVPTKGRLRPWLLTASAFVVAAGCSGSGGPSLPSLPQIAEALSLTEAPVVGPPTEVYARIARGVMACWFGTSGPLKPNYIYHAEAEPASQGGKAEILIHERDRKTETQRGLRAFRVAITPQGESTRLAVENLAMAEPLATSMQDDVRRWASGAIGCTRAEGDWAPLKPSAPSPSPPPRPKLKKGHPA